MQSQEIEARLAEMRSKLSQVRVIPGHDPLAVTLGAAILSLAGFAGEIALQLARMNEARETETAKR